MRYRCLERGIPFEARMMDGRNWEELVRDINDPERGYDLVVMGALGMGAVKESRLGSVTERVVRRVRTDTIVVRRTGESAMEGGILVAVDGSPQSFGGLRTALALGRALDKPVEAVAVYDPYLHYAVFNSIVDVLSEKASKVFRFKEQEALHEEIIDTGLAKIYTSHLEVARATAAAEGVDLPITLLDGKAFEQLLRYARERRPWLLVMGRIGVHSDEGMDIGGASEQLLRLADCNVLLSSRTHVPPIDVRADASVVWTPEAEARMERIPAAARGIARTAVLRWCTERGHSVVSSGDVDVAVDELMPFQRTMRRIGEVAGVLDAAERAMREEPPLAEARGRLRHLRIRGARRASRRVPGLRRTPGRLPAHRRRGARGGGVGGGRRRRDRVRRAQARLDAGGPRAPPSAAGGLPAPPRQGDRREARAHAAAAGDHARRRGAARPARARGARRPGRAASRSAGAGRGRAGARRAGRDRSTSCSCCRRWRRCSRSGAPTRRRRRRCSS